MKRLKRFFALLGAAAVLCACQKETGGNTDTAAEAPEVSVTQTASEADVPETAPSETDAAPETGAAEGETADGAEADGGLLRTDGSTSATPLETGLRAAYFGIPYSEAEALVEHTTTHGSFRRLLAGEVDLILSVPLSAEQRQAADEAGVSLFSEPIAKEGFVFVVNVENPVERLTSEQLRGIYSGEITNWAQVGGNDEPIVAYQRNNDSGSQNYMTVFMGDTPLAEKKSEWVRSAMGTLMDAIASYDNAAGAIGYSVYSYAAQMYASANRVKFIAVDGVAPSKATMADGSYPLLSATELIYTDRAPESVKEFVQWALSDEGQTAVLESGYLPADDREIPERYLPYASLGTGEPRPEGVTADRKYSYYIAEHGWGIRSTAEGYYELNCLSDTAFQERINADLREATDALRPYYDPKYKKNTPPLAKGLSIIANARNGYLSIILGYQTVFVHEGWDPLGKSYPLFYDYAVTLNYDLFRQERIERFSDLFYEGEDFVPLLNAECTALLEKALPSREDYPRKADFSGIVGEPSLFTIERIGFAEGNPYFYERFFQRFADTYMLGNELYDLSPLGVYRDMRGLIDEKHASEVRDMEDSEWIEDFYEVDGIRYLRYAGSRFHTDEEVARENELLERLQAIAREEVRALGRDFDRQIDVQKSKSGAYYEVGEFSPAGDGYVSYLDAQTLRPLTPEQIFGEDWREYIVNPRDPVLSKYTEFGIQYFYASDDRFVMSVWGKTPEGEYCFFEAIRPVGEVDPRFLG